MKFSLTLLALTAATASAAVPSLTPDNYDAMTDGKTVFIKFFAPWCGHCKKMAPDWEKLSGEWEGHEVGLVAEVDCTADGKPLCDANGVKGFPTLKYGDPSALDDYQGGRTFSDLSSFAKENLKPVCSPAKIELCDDEKKKEIETLMTMSSDDLASKIAEEEQKLEDAEEDFKNEVQKLQEKYQALMEEKDAKAAAVKAAGLGLMKSVVAFKAKADKEL
mmetsp:Transcript_2010/g.1240  ORF Transcript_2010/g.1240 Transcript_2010/m.1240 type:complete len:219 (+) Transcript_2010:81-737(+)